MSRALLLVALVGIAAACSDKDPDCQQGDFGSCGNACCKLSFVFAGASPEGVQSRLADVLNNGGPDGRYALQTTAEGTFGFTAAIDYMGFQYLGQAYHTTQMPGPDHPELTAGGPYIDSVHFLVYNAAPSNVTTVRAFSISQINGALGDHGQNYKNIIQVMREAKEGKKGLGWTMTQEDNSCPLKK